MVRPRFRLDRAGAGAELVSSDGFVVAPGDTRTLVPPASELALDAFVADRNRVLGLGPCVPFVIEAVGGTAEWTGVPEPVTSELPTKGKAKPRGTNP